MIKSIEAVMAIMILLMFMLILFGNYTYNDYKENLISEKTSQIISIKAQDFVFRNNVDENKLSIIYDNLYQYIDSNYAIKVCDFLEEESNCDVFGDSVPEKRNLYSTNYFFHDINKTLNVIIWS